MTLKNIWRKKENDIWTLLMPTTNFSALRQIQKDSWIAWIFIQSLDSCNRRIVIVCFRVCRQRVFQCLSNGRKYSRIIQFWDYKFCNQVFVIDKFAIAYDTDTSKSSLISLALRSSKDRSKARKTTALST